MRIEKFLDLDGNQHPDQVLQANSGFMSSKKRGRRRNDRVSTGTRVGVLLAAALLSCAGSFAVVDKLKELQNTLTAQIVPAQKLKTSETWPRLNLMRPRKRAGRRLCCLGLIFENTETTYAGFRASEEQEPDADRHPPDTGNGSWKCGTASARWRYIVGGVPEERAPSTGN